MSANIRHCIADKNSTKGDTMTNILHSSESNEWYTPKRYVDAAREVMGGRELDPASCAEANEIVKAKYYFTSESDGLSRPWNAESVWLNPPYGRTGGRSNQDIWSEKLIDEYEKGHVKEAVLLVNAVPDRKWFQRLWEYPICFTDHRIKFISPDNSKANAPTHGSAFVYFGPMSYWEAFENEFEPIGHIVWPNEACG